MEIIDLFNAVQTCFPKRYVLSSNRKDISVMKKQKQLKTNRNLFAYIILSIITLGIYSIYFLYRLKKDVNIACAEDGKHTRGIIAMFFLGLITLGIYWIAWEFMLINRMHEYCVRHKQKHYITYGSFLLWQHLPLFGTFIAFHKLCKTANVVMRHYNERDDKDEDDYTIVGGKKSGCHNSYNTNCNNVYYVFPAGPVGPMPTQAAPVAAPANKAPVAAVPPMTPLMPPRPGMAIPQNMVFPMPPAGRMPTPPQPKAEEKK